MEAEFPGKDARTESVLGSNVSDRPTKDDSFGFKPYVAAIRDFLTNDSTRGPLTLSVEGDWGTGRSITD
jgi:predicted KAP-like P-loop ATPase